MQQIYRRNTHAEMWLKRYSVLAQVFSCELFFESFDNTFFTEHVRATPVTTSSGVLWIPRNFPEQIN